MITTVGSLLLLLSMLVNKPLQIDTNMYNTPVIVQDMPEQYMGATCPADTDCVINFTSIKVPAHTISINSWFWTKSPTLMAHIIYHEYGHVLFGSSEIEAEKYACSMLPMNTTVTGEKCVVNESHN